MNFVWNVFRSFTRNEKWAAAASGFAFVASAAGLFIVTVATRSILIPVAGGAYREGVVGQPSIVNPLISSSDADEDLAALLFAPLQTLLASAEQNDDASVYTLKLKEDLAWDDGAPLTSDDVVFAVETAQDPAAESPFTAALRGVNAERISALQVKLVLPSPNAFFKETLARLPIVPAHIWGRIPLKNYHLSEYALAPVGNGPYRVKSFSKSRDGFIGEYRLVPNPRYAGPAPFIEDFRVRFFEDTPALLDAFRLRKIHGFGFVSPFPEFSEATGGASEVRNPLPRYYAVFINTSANDLLTDRSFRLALSRAVNRERISSETFRGGAAPYLPGAAEKQASLAYNPERARDALAKAKGSGSGALVLTVPDIPALVAAAEIISSNWRAIGIQNITIRKVSANRFGREVLEPRAYELVLAPHVFANPDDLYPLWHSSSRGAAGQNFSLYASKKMDALLERIREIENPERRGTLAREAESALAEDVPAVFLVSLPYVHVHVKALTGFPETSLAAPADRFLNVSAWSVARVRVLD
ncbi:MAG: hypothetical protein HYU81_02005 [Candidatus Brennerbacteria bacterium]|nr:hypothetical protein [Candidatus Brennerbacteria bacterium]